MNYGILGDVTLFVMFTSWQLVPLVTLRSQSMAQCSRGDQAERMPGDLIENLSMPRPIASPTTAASPLREGGSSRDPSAIVSHAAAIDGPGKLPDKREVGSSNLPRPTEARSVLKTGRVSCIRRLPTSRRPLSSLR